MQPRRLFACAIAALALLASPAAALAATHSSHVHKVSGKVVSINARRHTLRLRVQRASRAHAAVAQGGPVMVVSFGKATVTGPNGAVAVGDEVTVTTQSGGGQSAVASSIQVIGQPNGGDAGKGAAVPGEVSAVDAHNGTLTLSVRNTDSQGDATATSVMVTVGASTILAVSDTNGDGAITLADISVGDHVVVFTGDATANPLAAIGILDASHSGTNHQGGASGNPQPTSVPGTVATVDSGGSTLTINVSGGPLSGHQLVVNVTPQTSFGGEDSTGDGDFSLADVAVGDAVVVYTNAVDPGGVVAVGIVDSTTHETTAPHYSAFNGTLAAPVGSDSMQVLVGGDGPLAGQTVTVDIAPGTSFHGGNASGGQVTALADIEPGDPLAVYVSGALDTQPLVAAAVYDRGTSAPPPPAPAPPAPAAQHLRFGGTVTDVRGDGLTVAVSSGGPLSGQTVIVSVGASTSFATGHGTGAGTANLAYISLGDAVEIYTSSESGSPIVAVGVVDDSVVTGSQSA